MYKLRDLPRLGYHKPATDWLMDLHQGADRARHDMCKKSFLSCEIGWNVQNTLKYKINKEFSAMTLNCPNV